MFQTIDEVIERFAQQDYVCSRSIATVVYLSVHLNKPILVEGPAGVGKTELAKVLCGALDHRLLRLQCYEGLDEAKALYEWEYAKQLLYTQILKDKIGEVLARAASMKEAVDRISAEEDVFFSDRFILSRPLLEAITSSRPTVLLIDEIDKSDAEFEAFLLEVLSDFQVSVPELGTIRAKHIPNVVLTSNNAREMSDALKRRCLHLYIDFPPAEQELRIVRLKVPGIAEDLARDVVAAVQAVRKLDLKQLPSISETLDWARALLLLNVRTLDDALVQETLSHDPQVRGGYPQSARRAAATSWPSRRRSPSQRQPSPTRIFCTSSLVRELPVDDKLIEFSNLLRKNGVRVSVAEDLDSFAAVRVLGLGSRAALKSGLRATMVKRAVDVPIFDELFDLFFAGVQEPLKAATARAQQALGLDPAEFQRLLEELEKLLGEHGKELSELAKDWMRNDTGRVEQKVREALEQARVGEIERPYQEGQFTHGMANAFGLSDLLRQIEDFRDRLSGFGLDPRKRQSGYSATSKAGFAISRELMKQAVRQELEKQDLARRESQRMQSLSEKSFFYLSEDEIRRMKEAVTRLAQRLKNVIAIKRKRAKRGRFDVKDTFRKNLQYGGIPFRIQFDDKKKDKPQVVILCDVSDSVRNVSRFMLQFVYSLQDLYSRVRSFIFVAETGEITRLFEENDIHEAIELALRGNIINVFAHSDFGRAFKIFHRDYITAVNKPAPTVIVLGDARNNYNLPNEWTLRDIRARAKQLIWLNPESKMTWGFGDSEMERYQPFCDVVEECRNLNQLYHVIDRLVVQ